MKNINLLCIAPIVLGLLGGASCIIENRKVWKRPNIEFVTSAICLIVGFVHYFCHNIHMTGFYMIIESICMMMIYRESDKADRSTRLTTKINRFEFYCGIIIYCICGFVLMFEDKNEPYK